MTSTARRTITACGAPSPGDGAADGGVDVYVSAPSLAWVADRVAGEDAEVTNLLPSGADPHGAELSPAAVAELAGADLFVYTSGLQPAVDEAVVASEPAAVVDTIDAATAEIDDAATAVPPDPTRDPHFWLDPVRFGLAAQGVADALAEIDPDHADGYHQRAEEVVADLTTLDEEYRTGLATCAGAALVTSHEAWGYLAARYDLVQQGITGVDPEVEPSPARLRDVRDVVTSTGARTIFFETAADPGLAETMAEDLGVELSVLDPMERSVEGDYLDIMRTNLQALTDGLVCAG